MKPDHAERPSGDPLDYQGAKPVGSNHAVDRARFVVLQIVGWPLCIGALLTAFRWGICGGLIGLCLACVAVGGALLTATSLLLDRPAEPRSTSSYFWGLGLLWVLLGPIEVLIIVRFVIAPPNLFQMQNVGFVEWITFAAVLLLDAATLIVLLVRPIKMVD